MASFGAFLTYLFSLPPDEEKMKQMLNTLNISEFVYVILQISWYSKYIPKDIQT